MFHNILPRFRQFNQTLENLALGQKFKLPGNSALLKAESRTDVKIKAVPFVRPNIRGVTIKV